MRFLVPRACYLMKIEIIITVVLKGQFYFLPKLLSAKLETLLFISYMIQDFVIEIATLDHYKLAIVLLGSVMVILLLQLSQETIVSHQNSY